MTKEELCKTCVTSKDGQYKLCPLCCMEITKEECITVKKMHGIEVAEDEIQRENK